MESREQVEDSGVVALEDDGGETLQRWPLASLSH